MNSDETLAAALTYAERGLYVFPVRLGVRGEGKKDVRPIDNWNEVSSRDPEQITKWWTNGWAGAALAIDTGRSGLVVADQDVSDGKRGPENWEILGERSEFRVRTPSGGLHDYYREDPKNPVTVANRGEVADGVDVRGIGGFVFAPPTIDPRGGRWEWELGEIPDDFTQMDVVPPIIPQRVNEARSALRPKPEVSTTHTSQLFASPSQLGMNGKRKSDAQKLLTEELEAFRALTQVGNGRSHILAQRLGVLAGHGVDVFWGYQDAMDTLMQACVDNGFTAEHGNRYAEDQARRGLEYGMREPWISLPELESAPEPTIDAVDSLLAEMRGLDEIKLQKPPRMLIQGLLTLDSESWVIGAPGSKKSFVVLSQALAVAEGRPWMGLKVTQGMVIMIVAEGSGGLGARVQAWEKENGRALPLDVKVLPRPVQAADVAAWRVLVEACRRLEPALVVIDTQARVTVGLEENSAKEMGQYVEAVRAIREATGACVLSVHHTGRAGGDARGSSAIDGAQTTELKVESTPGALRGKLKGEKQKDLALAPDIELNFVRHVVGVDEDGQEISSLALSENPYVAAEGQEEMEDIDFEPWRGKEPEGWTGRLVAPQAGVKRRILQVLHDHAGTHGLTESKVRAAVSDRWRKASDSGWIDAWSAVKDLDCVINSGGERWILDRLEAGLE
jgi:hypothetical protein